MAVRKRNTAGTGRPRATARGRAPAMPHQDFGSRLAALRQSAALTQSQLAERLGISRRQIAYYESGTGRPPGALLPLLADMFEVSTDVLLGRELPRMPASRISRALLDQLQQAERMGSDACRRLEGVLRQFIIEEKKKRAPAKRRAPPRRQKRA